MSGHVPFMHDACYHRKKNIQRVYIHLPEWMNLVHIISSLQAIRRTPNWWRCWCLCSCARLLRLYMKLSQFTCMVAHSSDCCKIAECFQRFTRIWRLASFVPRCLLASLVVSLHNPSSDLQGFEAWRGCLHGCPLVPMLCICRMSQAIHKFLKTGKVRQTKEKKWRHPK